MLASYLAHKREREDHIRFLPFLKKLWTLRGVDFRSGTAWIYAHSAEFGLPLSWPGFRKLAETVSSAWQVNQSLGISRMPGLRARVPSDLFAAEISFESVTWPAARMDPF